MNKKIKNIFYISLGFISLFIGVIGIFLPVLPTTPLVLLAAYFFAQSSKKYHEWLRNNEYFGETLRSWEAGKGLTAGEKWRMAVVVTITFGLSFYVCTNIVGRIVLLAAYPIPIAIAIFTKTNRGDSKPK